LRTLLHHARERRRNGNGARRANDRCAIGFERQSAEHSGPTVGCRRDPTTCRGTGYATGASAAADATTGCATGDSAAADATTCCATTAVRCGATGEAANPKR
jgi:hypothetical protein